MTQSEPLRSLPTSKGHTAIYKLHRYFARRPHNQFRALIEQVSEPGDVILDPMAGGGVVAVEGLTIDRRIISVDVNPIASLVQRAQVTEQNMGRVSDLVGAVLEGVPKEFSRWFSTVCQACSSKDATVRWFERAYRVACPECSELVVLSNNAKSIGPSGRPRPGRYLCSCGFEFRAVDAPRLSSVVLAARVRCEECGLHETCGASSTDAELADSISRDEEKLLRAHDLVVPSDLIPLEWDRQMEDALARKGFHRFSDLFTSRNRIILASFISGLRRVQTAHEFPEEDLIGAVSVFSALIRYVNNMTVSTPGWMDGRPVAWAKHAYWTPNEFIECNPFEYLNHRLEAARRAARDRETRFQGKRIASAAGAVLDGEADCSIVRADSRSLDLPDDCIDAIITDPPFGSNVQYGELTQLWSVWLGDLNPYATDTHLEDEVLVNRRSKQRNKTFSTYTDGLTEVFRECRRVLKQDGVMVFTFNNKDPRAWNAVMSAAVNAGFSLGSDDIAYQNEIEAYRDTAHLRFKGEIQGDIVYRFRATSDYAHCAPPPELQVWLDEARDQLRTCVDPSTKQEQRLAIHLESVRQAAAEVQLGVSIEAEARLSESRALLKEFDAA